MRKLQTGTVAAIFAVQLSAAAWFSAVNLLQARQFLPLLQLGMRSEETGTVAGVSQFALPRSPAAML